MRHLNINVDLRLIIDRIQSVKSITRKFIVILMLLWLQLSSGSALAATVSMQMHDACHDMAMPTMQFDGHHHAPTQHRHGVSCNICGDCHIACCGYLASQPIELAAFQTTDGQVTPYLVAFTSVTVAPLDPPPLARL